MLELFEQAQEIGRSKTKLKKRLLEARAVLKNEFRPLFKNYVFDFNARRLYSSNLVYFLQWKNTGQTSRGDVGLFQVELKNKP